MAKRHAHYRARVVVLALTAAAVFAQLTSSGLRAGVFGGKGGTRSDGAQASEPYC